MKCIEGGFSWFSWGGGLSGWQAERLWVGILAGGGMLGCCAVSCFVISIWHDICVDYRSTQALML